MNRIQYRGPRHRQKHAFTLVEMLLYILLFNIAGVIAFPVMSWTRRLLDSSQQNSQWSVCADQAVGALRSDVWGARSVQLQSPHKLVLTAADQKQITWDVGPAGILRRTEAGTLHDYGKLLNNPSVTTEGPSITLAVSSNATHAAAKVSMVSQLSLLNTEAK